MSKINKLISDRFSPRKFSNKAVEKEKTDALFEAARWAPSCFNDQPWRFIYCTKENPEGWEKIFSSLVDANKVWAISAPVLAISIATTKFTHNGKANRFAAYDTGMAVGNLLLQATDMGLFVHQMAGFDSDKARKALNIPDEYEIFSVMAIGYLDDEFLSESIEYKAGRKRKESSGFAFKGNFDDNNIK
jgi:nitroreductase